MVPAGEETELLVGVHNEGNLGSILAIYFMMNKDHTSLLFLELAVPLPFYLFSYSSTEVTNFSDNLFIGRGINVGDWKIRIHHLEVLSKHLIHLTLVSFSNFVVVYILSD